MRALLLKQPGELVVEKVHDPVVNGKDILLKVRLVGLCGSDLNSYRGKNPMVTYPLPSFKDLRLIPFWRKAR